MLQIVFTRFVSSYFGASVLETIIRLAVKEIVSKTGVGRRIECRTFRHSLTTHLIESGSDIRAIQKLLGHKNIGQW